LKQKVSFQLCQQVNKYFLKKFLIIEWNLIKFRNKFGVWLPWGKFLSNFLSNSWSLFVLPISRVRLAMACSKQSILYSWACTKWSSFCSYAHMMPWRAFTLASWSELLLSSSIKEVNLLWYQLIWCIMWIKVRILKP